MRKVLVLCVLAAVLLQTCICLAFVKQDQEFETVVHAYVVRKSRDEEKVVVLHTGEEKTILTKEGTDSPRVHVRFYKLDKNGRALVSGYSAEPAKDEDSEDKKSPPVRKGFAASLAKGESLDIPCAGKTVRILCVNVPALPKPVKY